MSVHGQAVGAAKVSGQENIRRWQDMTYVPLGTNTGDDALDRGFARFSDVTGVSTTMMYRAGQATTLYLADGRRGFLSIPSPAGATCRMIFRPRLQTVANLLRFRDTYGPILGGDSKGAAVAPQPSVSIECWLRKTAAGGQPTANFHMGFGSGVTLDPSGTVARAGLMGDGVGGFRFGSLNCPDGLAAGYNGASDIDPGTAVVPTGWDAPGTDWFHARVKMIPPTANAGGIIAFYAFETLQGFITGAGNLPRGNGATNWDYKWMECNFIYYGNAVAPPADSGVVGYGLRVRVEDDWTL